MLAADSSVGDTSQTPSKFILQFAVGRSNTSDRHNSFAIRLSGAQVVQPGLDSIQPLVHLLINNRHQLALRKQLQQLRPHALHRDLVVLGIGAPMDPDHGDVLEQDPVRRDLLDRARRKPNHQHSGTPRRTPERVVDQADRVVDHIRALAARDLEHLGRPVLVAVVDRVVGAVGQRNLELLLRASRGNDLGAQGACNLNSHDTHTSSGGVDKAPFAGLQLGADRESDVAGRVGDEESCGLLKGQVRGDGEEGLWVAGELLGVAALGRAKDTVADLELGLGLGVEGGDDASELGAGDVRVWGLDLVLLLDLFFFLLS